MLQFLIIILAFIMMEITAWATHKYVMHGFLWSLHEDHHKPVDATFQKNDSFALIFAIPSLKIVMPKPYWPIAISPLVVATISLSVFDCEILIPLSLP